MITDWPNLMNVVDADVADVYSLLSLRCGGYHVSDGWFIHIIYVCVLYGF